MAKIHIVGGPGSGKSTLAKVLSTRLNCPHHDLDIIGQKNGTNAAAHIEDAFAIAATAAWVGEGIYLVLVDPLLFEADYIVLLDVPLHVAAWRMTKRHIVKTLRGTNPYPGWQLLFKLLAYSRGYYLNEWPEHGELMQRCLKEHRRMPLPPTPETMIAFLDTYHQLSIPPSVEFVRMYLQKYRDKVLVIHADADQQRLFEMLEGQK